MLDARDLKILDILQRGANMPVQKIADRVNISPSACSRRITRLRDEGFILKTVALIDRLRLNLRTTVYVIIRARHRDDWLEKFREAVGAIPQILECHRLAGDFDYLLKVVVESVEGYDKVYKQLIAAVDLNDVSAYFSMETIKDGSSLPLDHFRAR